MLTNENWRTKPSESLYNWYTYSPAYKDKVLLFGHVPTWKLYPYDKKIKKQNAKVWFDKTYRDKSGIDTGACFGRGLAMLELPSYREFYV